MPIIEDKNLLDATRSGNLTLVKDLVAKGANVNAINEDGNTALLIATLKGHGAIVRFLLEKGADPNLLFDKK